MFEGLLKGKFFNKCKLAARMTKARLEMIKKKRIAMHKFLRNDIAELLKNGLDKNAYDRAEGYLVEQNRTSYYEFVDRFCLQILNNVSIMSKQSECPQDCNEAVSSLIYAAARFADLPDLRDLRKLFTERYGTSLDSYVNKEFVDKLKWVYPSKDMKLQLMKDIAEESGVQWDQNAAERKLFNHVPQDFKQVNSNANDDKIQAHRHEVDSPKIPEERIPFRKFPREVKKEVAKENVDDNEILEKPLPPPPNRRSNVDQISDEGRGAAVGKSKPKPISVRRRRSKIDYNEGDVGVSSARSATQDSNHNEPDEEERILDKMLLIHCQKKSTWRETESDQKSGLMRHGSWDVGISKEETKKVPDYDELVARLAAFREDI